MGSLTALVWIWWPDQDGFERPDDCEPVPLSYRVSTCYAYIPGSGTRSVSTCQERPTSQERPYAQPR